MAPAHSSLKRERSSSPDGNVSDSARRASSVPVKKARLSSQDSDDESVYIPGIGDDDGASVAASTDAETEDEVDGGVDAVLERAQQAAVSIPRRQLTAAEKRQRFDEKYAGVSPEEALKDVASRWTSDAYKHFKAPIIQPARNNGRVMHRFICRKYPSKSVLRADYEDSTGNLNRHVGACSPPKTQESEAISAYGAGSQYSYARLRFLAAMWCARRHRPYVAVEDPEFKAMLKMLYGRVDIPTRMTVSRDVQFILGDSKKRVIVMFKNFRGRIHLCIDGWTSPNILAFLGITVHWHDSGKIRHIILDFVRLTNAHTGKYLAEKVVECLQEFGIEKKVFAVTVDNAENNTTMLKEMHELVPEFRGECVRVRCFGHVLNLVVKAVLSQFTRAINDAEDDKDEAHEDDAEAAAEADEAREAADQALIDALDDEDLQVILTPEDLKHGRDALHKVIQLSRKVWNSPTIRAELSKLAVEADLNSEVLVRAVKTRWNTVTEVLERALDMREVLGDLCDMAQFNKKTGARLRRFLLDDDEWTLLEQLWRLLDPFLFATKQISTSDRALVQDVIPYMDVLTHHIDRFKTDESLTPAVRAAAQRGRRMLDKYYTLTDETIIYRISMILHPRYKTQYFRDEGWPEEWIQTAVDLLVEEWQEYYKPAAPPPPPPAPAATLASQGKGKAKASSSSGTPAGRRSAQAAAKAPTRTMFESISKQGRAALHDALEVYLEAPQQETITDPLEYWYVRLQTGDTALPQMALDFLSIPATSTDAERAFSRGHLTVSRLRHSLSEESVRASTVLGSWANIPELVPEAVVVDLLKQSARKPRAAANAGANVAGPSNVAAAPAAAGAAGPKTAASSKSAGKAKASAIIVD